ncbi:uncharacterized protein LOC111124842 [Crassostrea virginica]
MLRSPDMDVSKVLQKLGLMTQYPMVHKGRQLLARPRLQKLYGPPQRRQGTKKNREQVVAPPKMWTDHVDYPPYVHRTIRILSRAEQRQRSQTEKEKEKDNLISRHITQECENTMDDKFSRALIATEDTKC